MRFRRAIWLIVLVLLLPQRMLAGQTATSKEVSLYVTVEQDSKLIQGLRKDNFRLYVDNEPQEFRLEEPERPASIALLVENSESSWSYWNDIASAMGGFLDASSEGHWYAMATFAHDLTIHVDFTKRRGEITSAFSSLQRPFWNEIDTYDAVYEMLDKLGRLSGRRILIFIGSGLDSFSSHSIDEIKQKLESTNVVTFAVGAGSGFRTSYEPYLGTSARLDLLQAEAFLNMLANRSGGQAWFPRFEAAFPDVMKGIMQTIENQYRLIYGWPEPFDEVRREIRVEAFTRRSSGTKGETFEVRVRPRTRF